MNIQIFGKTKCFACRNAERFFKERKIRYQFINTQEKGMSLREIENVLACVIDIDLLFDKKSSLYESLNLRYITRSADDKKQLLLDNPTLLSTPIVRDCDSKKCTVGSCETVWKSWLK